MKKRILTFITTLTIFILTFFTVCGAVEPPVMPTQPTELTEESVAEYNAAVDTYNLAVEQYNLDIDTQYKNELNEQNKNIIHNENEDAKVQEVIEYNQAEDERVAQINTEREEAAAAEIAAINEHNASEDEKVAENQAALDQQAQIEAQIAAFEEKGIPETRITNAEDLPTNWSENTTSDPVTIKVEEAEKKANESYNVLNLHVYLNESDEEMVGCDITDESFDVPENIKDNMAMAEWENITVDKNDIVTVISEAEAMGYRSAAFYRKMPGFTNGYWMPDYNEFISTAEYSYSTWYKGAAQEFSYIDGTTDNQDIKNVLSLYTYSFVRTGAEPEHVDKYIPDYWENNVTVEYEQPIYKETYIPNYKEIITPIKGAYLNTLTYLTYTPPQIEPQTKPIEESITEPVKEPITPLPQEDPVIYESIEPIVIPEPVNIYEPEITFTSTTTELIEIKDLDTPLAGGIQLYDFRGIPIQYSPGESGIYKGSNRGMVSTGGYLVNPDKIKK